MNPHMKADLQVQWQTDSFLKCFVNNVILRLKNKRKAGLCFFYIKGEDLKTVGPS